MHSSRDADKMRRSDQRSSRFQLKALKDPATIALDVALIFISLKLYLVNYKYPDSWPSDMIVHITWMGNNRNDSIDETMPTIG